MRVLVTGHLGYIGSVLVPLLRQRGHAVVGLDTGFFKDCILGVAPERTPEIVKDLRDLSAGDLEGFDGVCHLAGLSNDPLGSLDPALTSDINHSASVRLAQLARESGVPRFLFSSSCSIYGASRAGELCDETAPLKPLSAYAASKARAEEDIAKLAAAEFSPAFLRNGTAFGFSPRLRMDLVLNDFVGAALTCGTIRILSDGSPWRPLVHVADIAQAFATILETPREQWHNQALNIGCEEQNYRVRDLAEIVQKVLPESRIEYAGTAGPDPRDYRVSFAKVRKLVPGFKPQWNAERGARDLAQQLRALPSFAAELAQKRFVRLAELRRLIESAALIPDLRWRR